MSNQWGGYGPPGQPPVPYGPQPYGPPPDSGVKNVSVAALVANIVAVFLCCGVVSIGGVICAAIAMNKSGWELETARKLNMWAWILLGATIVLDIVFVIFMFLFPAILAALFGLSATDY